jgi:hypothetical protein
MTAAVNASAVVNVSWTSVPNAIKQSDGTTNAPAGWYVQLIWSDDAVISPLNPVSPFVPTGGEQVLKAQGLTAGGFLSGGFVDATGKAPGDGVGGFVYTRVFNVPFSVTPNTPTMFGNSAAINGPLAADVPGSPGIPPAINTTTHNPVVTVGQQIVAIPEPSTYALAAVGIAAALWRRRRKA